MFFKSFVRVASILLLTTFALLSLGIKEVCAHETLPPFWNQFRGPTANGKSLSQQLPIRWNETTNICWKTPVSGKAWSSPVISENTVWLSNATEDGRRLSLLAIDVKTGGAVFRVRKLLLYQDLVKQKS